MEVDDCMGDLTQACSCAGETCTAHKEFKELSTCMRIKVALERNMEIERKEAKKEIQKIENMEAENTKLDEIIGDLEKSSEKVEKEIRGLFLNATKELNALPKQPRWVKIESVVDSGAAESVASPSAVPWQRPTESEGSRQGHTYTSADGSPLPNLGEQILGIVTDEGWETQVKFQMAEVTKPLCAVSKICDQGSRVIFEQNAGYIENLKDGSRTVFKRENNVYILNMWLQQPGDSDFPRPSR